MSKPVKKSPPASPLRAFTPQWRELTILSQDPGTLLKDEIMWSVLKVPAEPLLPGPCGARLKVVDYDASLDRLYKPTDEPYDIDGVPHDPMAGMSPTARLRSMHFHQQNVFAIATRVMARFETALGRRVNFAFPGHQLHLAPHAFCEANAYYSRESRALCFGYFPTDSGGVVYSCLSHDIVAHEMTHALLDGLRPRYLEPSSPDQAAFHEGFADVVALLALLADVRIVEAAMAKADGAGQRETTVSRSALTEAVLKKSSLLGLAKSMGSPLPNGTNRALRQSVALRPRKDWSTLAAFDEPHNRGEVFVHCLMTSFIRVWRARLKGLGEIKPGRVDRSKVVEEGATAASHLLTMAIRALDYCPPTDIDFSDYLSAFLTADREMVPDDGRFGYRDAVRTSFADWNILPATRSDGSGCWQAFGGKLDFSHIRFESMQRNPDEAFRLIWNNAALLDASTDAYCEVTGVRPIARSAPDGLLVRETVVDYIQIISLRTDELKAMGITRPAGMPGNREVRLYGGGVLVFDEFGALKFSVGNRVTDFGRQQARLNYLADSGFFDYPSEAEFSKGLFARLHLQRARG